MRIRLPRPEDTPAIAAVRIASWRTTYRDLLPTDFLNGLRTEPRERYWFAVLSGGSEIGREFVYVAENQARAVVAFASGGPNREEDSGYDGELYAIYPLEEYQQQGIGTALTRVAASYLAEGGTRAMLVSVLAGNPFRRFYEALGSRLVGTKPASIGGIRVEEVAHGWPDIRALLA